MSTRSCLFIAFLLIFSTSSCEKVEKPIKLPPPGTAQMSTVNMGIDYQDQFFFDFESGAVVKQSKVASWDLAFESSPGGYHIFLNGGKNNYAYNTGKTNVADVTTSYQSISSEDYAFDAPCGLPDSTGIGEWIDLNKMSRKEIYVIKVATNTYKKIIINAVSELSYSLSYGDLSATTLQSIDIPKDNQYNYGYFSFDNGGSVVFPDPPKTTWDIVFTRYRHYYYDLEMPYLVSGVLLNPHKTTGVDESSNTAFANISYSTISNSTFSNHRDVIGFDWKSYNIDAERYTVNTAKSFVVNTQRNQYWKLHFLSFYDTMGVKGSPSFEFERIQ